MKATRWLSIIVVTVLFSTFFIVQVYGLEAFNISAFDINMTVYEDNSYLVVETINVDFHEQRHGIIRSLPLKTYRGNPASISNVDVSGHKFSTDKVSGDLEIKIGDPNTYAGDSEKYIISYLYTIGDDGLKDMDELYWNLIGLDWDCTIDNVTFTINMPKSFADDRLNFTYGRKGSTQNDEVTWNIEGNVIRGALLAPLGPNEALTVALPLPEGYFSQVKKVTPSAMARFGWLLSIIPIGIGAALWAATGRKKQSFPTVEFYPPQGVTSADVGFLIDGRVDPFDITSLIIYWAHKGYLTITEHTVKKVFGTKKSFIFTKLRDPADDAREYEHEMFREMFYLGDGMRVSMEQLTDRFYATADKIKGQVKSSFEGNKETRIFDVSNTFCRWLLRITAFLGVLPGSYTVMKEFDNSDGPSLLGKSILMSLAVMITVFIVMHILVNWKGMQKKRRFTQLFLALLFSGAICGVLIYGTISAEILPVGIASILSVVILGILASSCNRRTELGIWYEERLVGFREFLKATELDRIKMLVEENPHYFYHVLPFAMVLGVTNKWAKNFDGIMTQPPDWYHSATVQSGFNASGFAYDLESGMRSVSVAMLSRPSSDSGGSSGGGSSGGGSGGGGGRSW